jgi:hypothetical protein
LGVVAIVAMRCINRKKKAGGLAAPLAGRPNTAVLSARVLTNTCEGGGGGLFFKKRKTDVIKPQKKKNRSSDMFDTLGDDDREGDNAFPDLADRLNLATEAPTLGDDDRRSRSHSHSHSGGGDGRGGSDADGSGDSADAMISAAISQSHYGHSEEMHREFSDFGAGGGSSNNLAGSDFSLSRPGSGSSSSDGGRGRF